MEPENTALILIGFQNEYFNPQGALYDFVKGASDLIANAIDLVERLRPQPILIVDTPIIFTPDYSELADPTGILKAIKELGAFKAGTKGAETIEEIRRFGERIVEIPGKRGLNAFSNTDLDDLLKRHGITTVALAGVKTSLCIDSTGRSAYEKGYKVSILSDCTAGTDDFEHKFYCEKIFPLYADVIDHERFLGRLDVSMTPLDSSELQLQIQHRLIEELAASEKRYRELVEHLREVIFECDTAGSLIFLNQTWVEILGHPISDSLGRSIAEFIYEEDREPGTAPIIGAGRFSAREPKELRFRHHTGDVVWLELSVRTIDNGRIVGSLYNINDRKRAREELQQAHDQLEVRVEERTTALRKTNQRLQQEVAEREQAEAALLQAKEAAEAATRAKSEFLAKMSHELRTPMNAIIGFTRLVMRRCKNILPSTQYDNLGKILISAERLLALINDILDLAKVEAGRIEMRPVTFTLEPLISECLQTIEPMLRGEKVQLLKDVSADLPRLTTDKDRLHQILTNLLSNAVKFTDSGSINVTAKRRGEEIMIAIADTGIGIPAPALERIFEEFHQVDGGATRQHGGTGLGLSISRHFARLLGGDITVQSTLGVGSIFTVTIPISNRGAGQFGAWHTDSPSDDNVAAGTAAHQKIVLVIDDDPNVIYLLRENLAEAGYRVIGAASADEGRQKAREFRPLAITLDILMPQQDGWQMLHELKTDASTCDIPIIVLSVVDNKDLAYRLGAFDCLLKPVDRERMLATLSRISAAMQGQSNEENPDRGGR